MKRRLLLTFSLVLTATLLVACGKSSNLESINTNKIMDNLVLASPAFTEGGSIPAKYTGEGENINPPLKISGVPENARSLVLIMDDPDAPMGVWDHWIVWNIPPQTAEIKEGELPAGAVVGTNSFGNQNYGGPYPPPGPAHRYVFKLYALNQGLDLSAGAKKSEVEKAMEGKILAQTTLTGKYNR